MTAENYAISSIQTRSIAFPMVVETWEQLDRTKIIFSSTLVTVASPIDPSLNFFGSSPSGNRHDDKGTDWDRSPNPRHTLDRPNYDLASTAQSV
jgi:hypothetical protein